MPGWNRRGFRRPAASRREQSAEALALAVADRADIDWAAVTGDAERERLTEQLRTVATWARGANVLGEGSDVIEPIPFWVWFLLIVAALKASASAVVFALSRLGIFSNPGSPLDALYLTHVCVYGVVGAALVLDSERDRRAAMLGTFFVLVASAFAPQPVATWAPAGGVAVGLSAVLQLQPDAFLSLFLWLFVRQFPHRRLFGPAPSFVDSCVSVSALVGAVLFGVNLLYGFDPGRFGVFAPLARRSAPTYFWLLTFGLSLGALIYMLVNVGRAEFSERRRVAIFASGLALGFGPVLFEVMAERLSPAYSTLMHAPDMRFFASLVIYPLFLTIPLTTAYSVSVHHVLDVRLLVRQALRHLLAKWTVRAATAVPLGALAVFAVTHRHEPLADLAGGRTGLALAALVGVGSCAAVWRERWLDAIDQKFFREHYDSRAILTRLIEQSRFARTIAEWLDIVSVDLERALHIDGVRLMVRDEAKLAYVAVDGTVRPLPLGSSLPALLDADSEPMIVALDNPRAACHLLPATDRVWLADAAVRLLVPLPTAGNGTVGFLAFGEKRSELPYSSEDRFLLRTLAASGGFVLERQLPRSMAMGTEATGRTDVELFTECGSCGRVGAAGRTQCDCGGRLASVPFPPALASKFRLDQRIGAGGMGIVYRATDLALARTVAIKTLPRVSPEDVVRLRREARAMASVRHKHLALIYGVETWRGAPFLIVEHLEGGTLADRLETGPLPVREALELGIALSGALESLHRSGVLHRDIKPSNIAFTHDRIPKLLDLGLATLADGTDWLETMSGQLAGTALYMAPEALEGAKPDTSLDLWSLALIVYEAIAGTHPLRGRTPAESLARARRGDIPDLRRYWPGCPASVADFLQRALANDVRQRPRDAATFRRALEQILHSDPAAHNSPRGQES